MENWEKEHLKARWEPKRRFEQSLVWMLDGWKGYAEAHKIRYESSIGEDGVLGEEWEAVGHALLGLLNGELGRLEGGSLDREIRNTLRDNGCNPEK